MPTTTHVSIEVHARALGDASTRVQRHRRAKVPVRATSDDEAVVAIPTQRSRAQVSDVKLVHALGVSRRIHVEPASWVTSSTSLCSPLVALMMQSDASVQTTSSTVSLDDHGSTCSFDHVVARFDVKEIRENEFAALVTIATQSSGVKQSSARIPMPPLGAALTLTDCDDALNVHTRFPDGWTPPIRHVVDTHELDVSIDDGALGTTSGDHAPFDWRYSPTEVGGVVEPVVPTAMQESDVVQALRRSGTEMLIEGIPVTLGTDAVVQLASTSPQIKSTGATRITVRALVLIRLIEVQLPSRLVVLLMIPTLFSRVGLRV